MGLFRRSPPSNRSGSPEWHEQEFAIDDPRIPAPIREAIRQDYGPGYRLYFLDTQAGGEWWLMDGEELIEAYWLE